MTEGTLVLVVGKLDTKIKDKAEDMRTGTFWFQTVDKKVLVLLPDGTIFFGNTYDVVKEDLTTPRGIA